MFCLQISKEEREQAYNEYRAYLKEKAERRKAAEDGEEGNADKHKVRVGGCFANLLCNLQENYHDTKIAMVCKAYMVDSGIQRHCVAIQSADSALVGVCPQKKRHKEKKDKRDRDGGDEDDKRHKRSKR